MGNRARHDDDVERTMPYRLIGDIDLAAVRVARLGHTQIGHGSPNLRPYYPDDRSGTIMPLGFIDATPGPLWVHAQARAL
jgi:hypothetical protein